MRLSTCRGGTLKERIRREGVLESAVAVRVALQITNALSEAHEKGVIHRDIKPQNLLVTQKGDVKVTDFGIARAAASISSVATRTGAVLGTAAYMSPEQARGDPVGPQSDLYSLGVVLYEMLTGTLPYEAESPIALAMMHINEPPRSPRQVNPEVPEPLNALTLKLLAKDPEDRYPSAPAFANDLDRVRSGLPLAAVDTNKTGQMPTPLPPALRSPGGKDGEDYPPPVRYGTRRETRRDTWRTWRKSPERATLCPGCAPLRLRAARPPRLCFGSLRRLGCDGIGWGRSPV